MIIDNDPLIDRHISVPKDMSQLSCSSFTAGIVEAVLDGLGFVRSCFRNKIVYSC
jgi:trafficking protein particle complex subunit 5